MAVGRRDAAYYEAEIPAGNRAAMARAITAVENEMPEARLVAQAVRNRLGRARVIGITGAPGAGKSTLVSKCISGLRARNQSVGVIAVDPSSPYSGGAILGDRIRMSDHGGDTGVFIRSLAARGHLGGLSRTTARVVDVMDAAGLDTVIIETVGTGQSEIEIVDLAQTVVVVAAPGLGDEIQAVKAGILEIANFLVVTKSDMPHARRTARQLSQAMSLSEQQEGGIPVLLTSAAKGEGIDALLDALDGHQEKFSRQARIEAARNRSRKLLALAASQVIQESVAALPAQILDDLENAVLDGQLDPTEAAREAARRALGRA
ncbi:MAG: methylmalonyl Co-A mutase-associated GTPase MeaB [Magnetospiraceae bacterium]